MTSRSGVEASAPGAAARAGVDGVEATGNDAVHGVRAAVQTIVQTLQFGAAATAGPAAADNGGRFCFVADFDSAEAWPDVPYDTAAVAARHDDTMRVRIGAVLDEAAQTLALRVPAAHILVNTQLQRALLRHSEGHPGTSTSHRAHVGSCLLTNLHQPAAAVQVAVEALTHEAIHQLLYRSEQANGLFCDLAPTPTFRSPWTGARLPLHSLVHASFVWFGLLTLWNTLALTPVSCDEAAHARARMAHCLFGFEFLDDVLDSPAFPVASISAPVLDALRGLAAAARHATQAAEPAATLRQAALARQQAGWPAALNTALSTALASTARAASAVSSTVA